MSTVTLSNNKRIAVNTLYLYARTVFIMLVTLYTSRVILEALGVEDFGIYNVVGGIVTMFQMLSGSLTAAITRFITYELGAGNTEKLKKVFSVSVTIQILLSLIILFFAETVGLWYLEHKMVIPSERLVSANWVYQLSLVTFIIRLISIPYNSCIIAHERMKAFAYIGIFDALGRLAIAVALRFCGSDRLIIYAVLMTTLAVAIRILYGQYSGKNFEECKFKFIYDSKLLKEMFSFAGWNFIGSSSAVLREHGGSLLINLFYGPVVNAAKGVAVQVNSAVTSFVHNFLTAVQPQITKSYANGERTFMLSLSFQSIRFSFYLLLLMALPILVSTDYILQLWLKEVPEHTITFVQLTLLFSLSEAMSHPLVTVMLATGRIKNYQIIVGGLQFLNLPLSYFFLKFGAFPEIVFIVSIIISQACLVARVLMLHKMVDLNIKVFITNVYVNILCVTTCSSIAPLLFSLYMDKGFLSFLIVTAVSLLSTLIAAAFVGCNKKERNLIVRKIGKMFKF